MRADRLEKNLIDIIKEEQAKLGYQKEKIRLYYPLSSLNHILDCQDSEEEMLERLQKLPESITDKLGNVSVTAKNERFCFHVSEQGSIYVHENMAENEFIRDLVELVARHDCTIEKILELFRSRAKDSTCQKIENGEFDWLIRFPEEHEDPYYYCFKDEGCHIIYHRFLPEDYEDFEF